MKRLMVLSTLLLLMVVLFAGCADEGSETGQQSDDENGTVDQTSPDDQAEQEAQGKAFTMEELAQFDGKDGSPAYVAVDGVIYDVSDSSLWPEGEHVNCNLDAMAGRDLSEVIGQAPPRMRDLLEEFPVVGNLTQ
jgi:predicted heme/steroid binding protein